MSADTVIVPCFRGTVYQVRGHGLIAFRLDRWAESWELSDEMDTYGDGEWIEDPSTGQVIAIMVGDDYEWIVDVDDLIPLADDEFCVECGQIDCGWCR